MAVITYQFCQLRTLTIAFTLVIASVSGVREHAPVIGRSVKSSKEGPLVASEDACPPTATLLCSKAPALLQPNFEALSVRHSAEG